MNCVVNEALSKHDILRIVRGRLWLWCPIVVCYERDK